MGEFITFLGNNLADFWTYTGFANATVGHVVMLLVGLFFIYLAVAKEFEPMLLIPIGFGMLIGNIPFNMEAGLKVGIYEEGSVLEYSVPGSNLRLVPATHIPGYRCHDGFLRFDIEPQINVGWCSSPIRYIRCLYDCPWP